MRSVHPDSGLWSDWRGEIEFGPAERFPYCAAIKELSWNIGNSGTLASALQLYEAGDYPLA
jgi:hypothetical protein